MKRSNRLLILVGVFLAVGAMVAVVAVMGGGGAVGAKGTPTATPEPTVTVVFAKVDMALGDRITASMLESKTMTLSQRDALGVTTLSSPDQAIGHVAGGTISKGSPLSADSFLNPGSMQKGQDISSSVATGMVALSMEVDQVNGVGTLIVPGDRVDVILSVWTPKVDLELVSTNPLNAKPKWSLGNDVTTKMVIQNRKVLVTLLPSATDEQTGTTSIRTGNSTPTPAAAKATTETITNSGQHMIVIIEVKRDEAEIIRWAQREEKQDPQNYITLGLALRSDKDNDAALVTTPGITFRQLVTIYGVLPPDFRGYIPADLLKLLTW